MNRFRLAWTRLLGSLWFVPVLVVMASIVSAMLLVEAQGKVGDDLARDWPRIFGAGADGSRAMLSSIATSMVTVAGVVFSITIVTLSLSATQYSPRILRNFMRDRPTQFVLGIFMGIYAYCLVVLRTVRADNVEFIPSLAVLAGMAYALVGIGFLIFYIHHVAQSIQASTIAERIYRDTFAAIDRLYPSAMGNPATEAQIPPFPADQPWQRLLADKTGYVTAVDTQALMELAEESGRLVRLHVTVGDFIPEGVVFATVSGEDPISTEAANRLQKQLILGQQRTVEQDAAYGFQQLSDVAVKALSPGINDPTTACLCIDRLGALLRHLASRDIPSPYRSVHGVLRVIAPAPDFPEFVNSALEPVIRYSRGDLQVADRIVQAVRLIAAATADRARRQTLSAVVRLEEIQLRALRPKRLAGARLHQLRLLRHELESKPAQQPISA